jgi:phosphate/sulfate permease
MFEAEVFGVDVGVTHLVAAIVGLAIGTTRLLVRATRLKPVATIVASLLITQVLAGAASVVLLRLSEQPVHDAPTWVAHRVAVFDAVVFWLLAPVFTAPAIGLVALLSRRRGVRSIDRSHRQR